MAIKFNRSQTFATGGTVTSAALHNLVDGTDIYPALITDQSDLSTVSTADKLLIADTDDTINAKSTTVYNLFDDALTGGTYTNFNLTGNLTYGTATGNRTVSTNASITTGTINNATLGTTTSTAATITSLTAGTTTSTGANITNGTVQTLTASTASITGGTFSGAINSTAGTIGSLNSTTGTIGNFTTTLAGDFTISGGTGTLGTTGVTAGTYGTNTAAVTLTLDAKGRVTTVSTSAISTTPAAGSITYPMLSTSGTESDNVAKRTAKAWVNFNGTGTPAIRDDFNVSSLTDHGSGDYTINFSTALASADYCAVGSQQSDPANGPDITGIFYARTPNTVSNPTTSGFRLSTMNAQSTPLDRAYVLVAVFL